MRIGIDVGGTFTDVVLIDDQRGKTRPESLGSARDKLPRGIYYTKTFTAPKNPAQGVLNGIEKILNIADAAETCAV